MSSLLDEIKASAVDPKTDLATLLRQCRLLADQLASQPLEDWILWESNGYPAEAGVPSYRIWPLQVRGHFSGPFGAAIRNGPIPNRSLPEGVRSSYSRYESRQSIAAIEETLKSNKPILYVPTGDLMLALGQSVYHGHSCLAAWGEFGRGQLVEVVNNVRNRILEFVLAIARDSAPEHGLEQTTAISAARVTQIFQTTIYGGIANVASTGNSTLISIVITPNDFQGLRSVLAARGIQAADLAELEQAVATEPAVQTPTQFGPKVGQWIAKMCGKAATGAWEISLNAAGELLATALSKYYGIN